MRLYTPPSSDGAHALYAFLKLAAQRYGLEVGDMREIEGKTPVRQLRLPLRFLERRITRDVKVPFSADDPEMQDGWRCIPIPPTADDGWFILDDSRDYRTEWARWIDRQQHDN